MADRRKKAPRGGAVKKTTWRPMPDAMKLAFQIGSFVRDAEWAIVRGEREKSPARLLQALAHLQDAGRFVDELLRVMPKRSKRSLLVPRTEAR